MGAQLKYANGIQSFEKMRTGGYAYVDKTADIYRLVTSGSYYFLSRPRRFGKSLLLSTIEEFFRGNRALFRGLAIDSLAPEPWEEHPVLHFDMNPADYVNGENEIEGRLGDVIEHYETKYGIPPSDKSLARRFDTLIRTCHEKTGKRVVILIDEYDKPILDAMGDEALEEKNRTILKAFYGTVKSNDRHIRFFMLTGVGKLGNVNVFSGFNNIEDITFSTKFSTMCGITEQELHDVYHPGVVALAEEEGWTVEEAYAELKRYYDGYHFAKDLADVYNPYSLILALKAPEIQSYWYQTGTPSYLLKALSGQRLSVDMFENQERSLDSLSFADVTRDNIVNTLYYTGYLTITRYDRRNKSVVLGFPNEEVRIGFMNNLLDVLTHSDMGGRYSLMAGMRDAIEDEDVDGLMERMRSFYSQFPSVLAGKNEAHYHDVFMAACGAMGFEVRAETPSSHGVSDLELFTKRTIYIFEFKVDSTPEEALRQIETQDYALRYSHDTRTVMLIGVNFSSSTRNIEAWVGKRNS